MTDEGSAVRKTRAPLETAGLCFASASRFDTPHEKVILSEAKDLCISPAQSLVSCGMPHYYVYIMTNRSKTLYTGMTNSLVQRVWQHKNHVNEGFTTNYKIDRLVYYERFADVRAAISREKEIKGWLRVKKLQLIVSMNPEWKDLAAYWYEPASQTPLRAKA